MTMSFLPQPQSEGWDIVHIALDIIKAPEYLFVEVGFTSLRLLKHLFGARHF